MRLNRLRFPPSPMKTLRSIHLFVHCLLLTLSGAGLNLAAKSSEWKDVQGTSFKGEPVEVIGPFAIFRTSTGSGQRMLLRGMPAEECLRFFNEISRRPALAEQCSAAKGAATNELIGRTLRFRYEDKKLIPADLSLIPEPQLLLVLYGSHGDGEAWTMLDNMAAIDARIQRVFPGLLQTVFMGVRHSETEHRRMATAKQIPWLIADFSAQGGMSILSRFAPAEGTNMVLLSREGVPLLSGRATDLTETGKFCDQLTEFLALINPANPLMWKDRTHYLGTTRLKEYAQRNTGPLLVGNPLRADGLRQRGIERIVARLGVAADGSVTPTLILEKSTVPPAMVDPLIDALRKAVVLPAVDHGVAVTGTLDYTLEVPPEDRSLLADSRWLSGELTAEFPIAEWLVLRPIKVQEQSFVDHENANGVAVLNAMQVTNAQVSRSAQNNAFNTDWFTATGAAGVAPKAGDKQFIDDEMLNWEQVSSKDGYVDLRTGFKNIDYCVGYAWTEFESPADMNAWLGIGSDDGLKIWLNGELVHDKWIRRMSRIDDDVVLLRLKKGPNRILIKIQNATGDWSFIYRLRTRGK